MSSGFPWPMKRSLSRQRSFSSFVWTTSYFFLSWSCFSPSLCPDLLPFSSFSEEHLHSHSGFLQAEQIAASNSKRAVIVLAAGFSRNCSTSVVSQLSIS